MNNLSPAAGSSETVEVPSTWVIIEDWIEKLIPVQIKYEIDMKVRFNNYSVMIIRPS